MSDLRPWLRAPFNAVAFRTRRAVAWSRGPAPLADEAKDGLFDFLPPGERAAAEGRERELRRTHDLQPLRERSSRLVYRENLYLLDVLERACRGVVPPDRAALRVVDVGAGAWLAVFAQERFFRGWGRTAAREVELDGVEIDGHVVLRDLRSRRDHALARAAQVGPHARYHVADVREWRPPHPCDVVLLTFPFLTRRALLAWGLPLALHAPAAVVAASAALVGSGGWLFGLSQTSEERDALQPLLRDAGLVIARCTDARSDLVHHAEATDDRWITLARRRDQLVPASP